MTFQVHLDLDTLRREVSREYAAVAAEPGRGFHFHTGRPLARMLGYPADQTDALPDSVIESFAGVGNPFVFGALRKGEQVLDIGSGAGFDTVLAANQVGDSGRVIGVDMTPEMLDKARANANSMQLTNVEFREGYAESLPIDEDSIDVVLSNGVINLSPDKDAVFREIVRVLKPGGRLQMADIALDVPVPDSAKENIDLWTG
jgi:SAM-dependent methyltransferase